MRMKKLLMNTAASLLMLPTLGWSAADGRGHNGPNLSPISIPMQLDRGIRLDHMNEAISVCFATGDAKRGVVSLTQRLAVQLTGRTLKNMMREFQFREGPTSEDEKTKTFLPSVQVWARRRVNSKEVLVAGNHPLYSFAFDFAPRLDDIPSIWNVILRMPGEFPKVKYHSIVQDTGYDDYGREDNRYRILRGLSVETDAASYGESVALYNAQSDRKTSVTLNTVEYVECLKSELQKRAE